MPATRISCPKPLRRAAVLSLFTLASVAPSALAQGPTWIPSGRKPNPYPTPEPAAQTVLDDPFRSFYHADLPAPNGVRDASGKPGPLYWQQRADYTIHATLDTAANAVDGTVTIRYTNNSPLPLDFIWLQLEQNIFRSGDPNSDQEGARLPGGFTIDRVQVNGRPATLDVLGANGTIGRLDLPSPVAAHGGRTTLSMHFRFVIPTDGQSRLGRARGIYAVAQWYPRVAVYDDVRGWNTDIYTGDGEFYLEYGDFDYSVTVPRGFVVAGSGVLSNPDAVLSPAERARLRRAARDTTVVHVIPREEAARRHTPATTGTTTWRFAARNVRDVAWAAAPDYQWDAVACDVPGQHVLCQAFYTTTAQPSWTYAASIARFTIRYYSSFWFPYPYPSAASVETPSPGMEYPMLAFDPRGNPDENRDFFVVNHELGHNWFPMIVGSNERRYAWMDEGFNTYGGKFADTAYGHTRGDTVTRPSNAQFVQSLTSRMSMPLMTSANRGGMSIGYEKPADVLIMLREHLLGPRTFDRAFSTYIKRWAFKHPTPADFFRTIEDVSGQDLGYLWRGFFYTDDVVDYGIDSMSTAKTDNGLYLTAIYARRMTSIPFPVTVRVKFADGSTKEISRPVDAMRPSPSLRIIVWSRAAAVGARLWPHQGNSVSKPDAPGIYGYVPDANGWNDVWGDAPDPEPQPMRQ